MLKTIKIALASSSELAEDRREFETFINRKNKIFSQNGVLLELIMWEDFIDAMSKDGLQKEYNKAMKEADIFVMLFFTKVGKYTLEEFENAFGHFKEHGKPFIYTYFKDANVKTSNLNKEDVLSFFTFQTRLEELKHYKTQYPNTESLLLQFGNQLEKVLQLLMLAEKAEMQDQNQHKPQAPAQASQKIDTYHLPKPTTPLVGRQQDLDKIGQAFNDSHTHIFAIIAAGGIGKSALTHEWLRQLKTKNSKLETPDHKMLRIFGWSFYSQGSHDTQSSSGPFLEAALPFFGHDLKKEPLTDDTKKGRKLAELLRGTLCILILDGLEPLQNKVQVDGGRLKDQALAALLRDVRSHGLGVQNPNHNQANNNAEKSLIIISSRQPLPEMENIPNYESLDLQHLDTEDGAALLKSLQIKGLQFELEKTVQNYGGHALALVLLGKLLTRFFKGDINQHTKLPELLKSTHAKTKQGVHHAERVMNFYNDYWVKDAPERCFLNLLGLFDRPMGEGEKNALLQKAEIAKPLAALSELDWTEMLNNLQDMALLLEKPQPLDNLSNQKSPATTHSNFSLQTSSFNSAPTNCQLSIINYKLHDTHPLIRTYFGAKFKKENPKDWQQAHLVLFEYLQNVPEQHQPDKLEELEPLYRAVVHSCLAGEYQKALVDVYWDRIKRGGEHYSAQKLGAYAQDLTAIAAFFPEGWENPVSKGLSEPAQAWLLAEASFCLMSLGRLIEAVQPRQATLKLREKLEDWRNAATTAENLVDLLLPLGQLSQARQAAEKAIHFADRADDWQRQVASRSRLGTILHRQGDLQAALKQFKQAEDIQKEHQPEYPRLYSVQGAWYCALLLDMAEDRAEQEAVLERGRYSLKEMIRNNWIMDIAFDHLTIARALFTLNSVAEVKKEFDQAVAGIRKAGKIEFMPEFLLERAKFHLHQKEFEKSQTDLDEAKEIIERCRMKLYETDASIVQGRLNLAQNKAAKAEFQKAKALIEQTGYHLRDREVGDFDF